MELTGSVFAQRIQQHKNCGLQLNYIMKNWTLSSSSSRSMSCVQWSSYCFKCCGIIFFFFITWICWVSVHMCYSYILSRCWLRLKLKSQDSSLLLWLLSSATLSCLSYAVLWGSVCSFTVSTKRNPFHQSSIQLNQTSMDNHSCRLWETSRTPIHTWIHANQRSLCLTNLLQLIDCHETGWVKSF